MRQHAVGPVAAQSQAVFMADAAQAQQAASLGLPAKPVQAVSMVLSAQAEQAAVSGVPAKPVQAVPVAQVMPVVSAEMTVAVPGSVEALVPCPAIAEEAVSDYASPIFEVCL